MRTLHRLLLILYTVNPHPKNINKTFIYLFVYSLKKKMKFCHIYLSSGYIFVLKYI